MKTVCASSALISVYSEDKYIFVSLDVTFPRCYIRIIHGNLS
jgi:hypothetical protein